MGSHAQVAQPAASRPARGSERANSEREDWIHEFRNALGNVTIAASAARCELTDDKSGQAAALFMQQIEVGCDRCLRLLGTMPR